ncbi:hypothetical protein [Paenibacillus durus]|uniref:Uncharacterized protein n=1 Tax=Paenibacillus durus TaxID=44251 RepID=A0A089HQU2_PAEDU|nr:hypothetical protein [Paenibacillus durus]AIQ13417.1 hypothetical protein PDUR_16960 [Paenibacillus durus]
MVVFVCPGAYFTPVPGGNDLLRREIRQRMKCGFLRREGCLLISGWNYAFNDFILGIPHGSPLQSKKASGQSQQSAMDRRLLAFRRGAQAADRAWAGPGSRSGFSS